MAPAPILGTGVGEDKKVTERLPNIHPGEVLREEFLVTTGTTASQLARNLVVPATRIAEILHGKRRITPDTALRLAAFLGTTAQFWLNLQNAYDLEEAQRRNEDLYRHIPAYAAA